MSLLAVKVEGLRTKKNRKLYFLEQTSTRKCFSPRWEARYLFHGKNLCGENFQGTEPYLKMLGRKLRIRKSRVKFKNLREPSLQHQGARFSFFASPINDGSLRFEPVGGETRGGPKQL